MLDIKLIRKEKAWYEEKIKAKEPDLSLEAVLKLDEELRHLKTDTEELQAARNEKSKTIGSLKREKKNAASLMEEVREIGEKLVQNEHKLAELEKAFTDALSRIPNIPMDDVKLSQNKDENVITKVVGEKPTFDFKPKNHLELNEKLHLFDFARATKLSGARFAAYRGLGAQLEWLLINYMIDIQILRDFEFWMPPLLVRPPIMFGSGQMPKFEGQFYEVPDKHEPLYLIPTAEVVLNGLHLDEILDAEELPKKYVAFTPCFRKESGSAGAEERGLIRTHQFHKVEMFCFSRPEESEKIFDEMINIAEEILQGLGLHYRLSCLVSGDMSFTAAKTVDIEVWLPGQNRYYEVSSISNCTDYQARRSQTRFKVKGGKPELVHTLNGSGLATSRLMVALLENNQNADGTVNLPPLLAEKLGKHRVG